MIKRLIITLFFSFTLFSTPSFSLELTVKIEKVKEFDKKVLMELFLLTDTEALHWEELPIMERKVVELNTESQQARRNIVFSALQTGKYALRVFQDNNNNGILDKSSNNIPLEPIGFSENPSLFGGEPSPSECAIILINDQTIVVNLKHRKPRKKRH
jgi:uncharacterized protein (DUF2141 family)